MTLEQLKVVNGELSKEDREGWVTAANMILFDSGSGAFVENIDQATPVIYKFFYDLLEAENYTDAATLLWGESLFDVRPQFVKDIFRVIKDNNLVLLQGASSVSKCLGIGTRVIMFDGTSRNIEDVKPGDQLMGDDSTPRNVLSAGRGFGRLYRITPERGDPWVCNDSHILTLRCGSRQLTGSGGINKRWAKGEVYDIPIEEYMGLSKHRRSRLKQFHVGIELKEHQVTIDPYCYGAWLGDGDTRGGYLSSPKCLMTDRWCKYFESTGLLVKEVPHKTARCSSWHISVSDYANRTGRRNWFREFVKSSSSNGLKVIRDEYMFNSRTVRMGVLAGLIDSDGTIIDGTGYSICITEEHLARQVSLLTRSLGFSGHLYKCRHKHSPSGVYFKIIVTGIGVETIPTMDKKCLRSYRETTNTGITIESTGCGAWAGVVIDGNHRFLLGDYTVTHNTYSAGAWTYLDWRRDPAFTAIKVAALSDDHLRKNIFSHIQSLHKFAAIPYEHPEDIKDVDLYFGLRSAGNQFGFSGIAFKQSSEASGHFKGYKPMPYRKIPHPKFGYSTRVRILGDEAQNWPEGPFKDFSSPISCISGVEHVKIVCSYNPESVSQRVVQLAEPEHGWQMEDMELLYEWISKEGWVVLRLDAKLCENVVQRRVIYANFQTYEGFMKLLKGEGDVSNRYATFARGFPPLRSQNWTVVPASWPASQRGEALFDEVISHCVSVDCAYQGLDKVIMTVGRFGIASGWTKADGQMVKFMDPTNPKVPKSRPVLQLDQQMLLQKSSSPTKLAEEIRGKCEIMGIDAQNVIVDGSGQGSGTASFLKEYWGDILVVDWAKGATSMKVLAEDRNTAKERYDGIISEMHFAFKEWLNPDVCAILIHPQISSNPINTQMSTRRFCFVKGGKVKVESKPEFKARNQRSPDEHDCFLAGTMVLTSTGEKPIESLSVGDMIVTPFGVSPVVETHSEKVADITIVTFSNGRTLAGKGRHKVFTWNSGWKSLDSLMLTDQIECDTMLPLWNILGQLFAKDTRSSFKHLVDTIRTETRHRRRDYFIESSGSSTMGLSLKACASITKMATGWITGSRTWSWFNRGFTQKCTGSSGKTTLIALSNEKGPLQQLRKLRHCGTHQDRELNGIESTPRYPLDSSSPLNEHVNRAESSLNPKTTGQGSAQEHVGAKTSGGIIGLMTNALCAVRCSLDSGITRKIAAPTVVRQHSDTKSDVVYNIQLADHNVYYANGILVQNCAIMMVHLIRSRANVLPGMATQIDNRKPVDDDRETTRASEPMPDDALQLTEDNPDMGRGLKYEYD